MNKLFLIFVVLFPMLMAADCNLDKDTGPGPDLPGDGDDVVDTDSSSDSFSCDVDPDEYADSNVQSTISSCLASETCPWAGRAAIELEISMPRSAEYSATACTSCRNLVLSSAWTTRAPSDSVCMGLAQIVKDCDCEGPGFVRPAPLYSGTYTSRHDVYEAIGCSDTFDMGACLVEVPGR